MKIIIRAITKKDENFLFLLRNNNSIRKEFFQSKKVSIQDHKKWFSEKMKGKSKFYFIILKNKKNIGIIRYDKKDFYYDISISILPYYQKQGLASEALNKSEKFLNGKTIIAKIKKNNKKSLNFFTNNGYNFISKNGCFYLFKIIKYNSKNKNMEIINQIQNIRSRNNVNWMDILRIAFEKSPDQTKSIFKRIFFDDRVINKLSRKLFS